MSVDHLFKHVDWVWESHLVNRLGINRDELRRLRGELLHQGADWRFEKNRVEISLSGARKLAGHLELPPAPSVDFQTPGREAEATAEPEEKNGAPGGAQEVASTTLHVWRIFPKNRHIIEGYKPGSDPGRRENVVRIKVRDSSRFTRFDNTGKPLAIECRHLQADFYEHVGALPKKRGRL